MEGKGRNTNILKFEVDCFKIDKVILQTLNVDLRGKIRRDHARICLKIRNTLFTIFGDWNMMV